MSSRNKFTVVSTFSGCGGSSLGYQMAGGKVLLAAEWDANAVATYRLNFPATPVYAGDVAKLSGAECCRLAGIKPGQLDIFDGSPPCQGFSAVGKRRLADDRNQLFREYVRLLRHLRPRCFVMENVSGMVRAKMRLIFADCLRELKASHYRVRARLLNAKYFGVPQSRARLIFIGVRDDLGIDPTHPKPLSLPRAINKVCPEILGGRYDTRGKFRKVIFRPGVDVMPTITQQNRYHLRFRTRRKVDHVLTTNELKAFATFPPAFEFTGKDSDAWHRIGNSVPPLFMKAIAEHIYSTILGGS